MNPAQVSIGKEAAIALAEAKHWEGMTHQERARFQLHTVELTMPFGVFQEAMEKTLGRPVWTHEFGLNLDGLIKEMNGDAPAPTMAQILELIPAEKRVVVRLDGPQ